MSEERSHFAQRIDEREFSNSRRGYNKREVKDYLEDLEQAFREIEGHARRTAQRVGDLERDLSKARATEKVSVDNAMMAVFDAKDRILERARRRASEIEEQAHAEALRSREAALADISVSGGAGVGEIAAARAQADEIVAAARREADRVREAEPAPDERVDAEMAALVAQVQRAHSDTAAARADLEGARRRIVELETEVEDSGSGDLDQRFGELESLVSTARAEADQLRGTIRDDEASLRELAERLDAEMNQVKALRTSAADAQVEREQLERELDEAKGRLQTVEAEAGRLGEEVERFQLVADEANSDHDAVARLETQAAAHHDQVHLLGFVGRMRADESRLSRVAELENTTALVAELNRMSTSGPDGIVPAAEQLAKLQDQLEQEMSSHRDAERRIVDLEAEVANLALASSDVGEATAQAEQLLAAARAEAEAIEAEAEEEADQRATKVIARAREEADQVRQTVATLTAQADDARSAALRSKLEAEDLVEAQRAMSAANEDIVAAAESRAKETRDEAERLLARAREEADQLAAQSEESARQRLAAAETQATDIVHDAEKTARMIEEAADDPVAAAPAEIQGDDLAVLLAEAEQEIADSEERRKQREALDRREAELAEKERVVEAHQAEAAALLASRREEAALPAPSPTPATEAEDGVSSETDEDPADRLSALLEQVVPASDAEATLTEERGEVVDLDEVVEEPRDDARPRVAWPTPMNDDVDHDDDEDESDADGSQRESRYRSRSARLPRLGGQAKSNMTTMANLRKKSRGINK